MTLRRPLVRINGRTEQLPPGDTLQGVPAYLLAYLPAYQAGGAMLKLALDLDYSLPVTLTGGGVLNVQVVLNG